MILRMFPGRVAAGEHAGGILPFGELPQGVFRQADVAGEFIEGKQVEPAVGNVLKLFVVGAVHQCFEGARLQRVP